MKLWTIACSKSALFTVIGYLFCTQIAEEHYHERCARHKIYFGDAQHLRV